MQGWVSISFANCRLISARISNERVAIGRLNLICSFNPLARLRGRQQFGAARTHINVNGLLKGYYVVRRDIRAFGTWLFDSRKITSYSPPFFLLLHYFSRLLRVFMSIASMGCVLDYDVTSKKRCNTIFLTRCVVFEWKSVFAN